jgi:hypothetical protein
MDVEDKNPGIDWYLSVSRDRGVTPRCPFSTVEGCPRYFRSLVMFSQAGSTKLDPQEEKRLDTLWENSDLLPLTAEHDTSMSGTDEHWKSFSNFCPETIYERFNYFASGLGDYADDIDRDIASERLAGVNAPTPDYRWRWAWIRPMHYTECPLYSPLFHRRGLGDNNPVKASLAPTELVSLKPGIWGVNINLNELWRRAQEWWRRRAAR